MSAGKKTTASKAPSGRNERGVTPGKSEGQHAAQAWALEHRGKGTEAERHAEDGRCLGEGHGHVVGGEGTERREPERCHGGSVAADTANEIRNEQTGRQINQQLQVENGEIILFSKNRKAQGEEAWVSGQANECRGYGWRAARRNEGPTVNAVG